MAVPGTVTDSKRRPVTSTLKGRRSCLEGGPGVLSSSRVSLGMQPAGCWWDRRCTTDAGLP